MRVTLYECCLRLKLEVEDGGGRDVRASYTESHSTPTQARIKGMLGPIE